MQDVRRVARKLSRVLEESGISARGAMHALAAAGRGDGNVQVAVLVADKTGSCCLFYPDGRRVGVVAVPGVGQPEAAAEAEVH